MNAGRRCRLSGTIDPPTPGLRRADAKGLSAPFGNLDQPYAGRMSANGFGHWMTTAVAGFGSRVERHPGGGCPRRGCREAAPGTDGLERRIMAKQAETKRKSPLSYRPPKDLEDEFERRVALSGLSVNAFLTEAWHGRNRHRPAELKRLSHILGLGQRMSDALKAFDATAACNAEIEALLDEIRLILTEIRSALFSLMGRRP